MIRRKNELTTFERPMFGGPGTGSGWQILNDGDFAGKGRLFNHLLLKPGCGVGKHTHKGDFEIYYVPRGEGHYDDNGTEVILHAGDVAICNAGESHALENRGQDDLEVIALILFA